LKFLLFCNGTIGNTIMYSPIFSSLKKLCPDSQVDVVFNKFGYEMYSSDVNIDKVYQFNRKKDSLKKQFELVREFRKEKYDFSLHLRSGVRNEMLAFLGGVKQRLGRKLEGSWQFLTEYVNKKSTQHAKDEYREFLKAIFGKDIISSPYLPVNEMERKNVESFLSKEKVEGKFLVVHPFGDTISEKCWQSTLFKKIISQVELPIFVLGRGKEMVNFCLPNQTNVNYLSDKNLGFVSELLKRASFFVGNDSGPFHIAECHRVRSFVFYQDNKDNFQKWSPLEKKSKVFWGQKFSEEDLKEIVREINEKA